MKDAVRCLRRWRGAPRGPSRHGCGTSARASARLAVAQGVGDIVLSAEAERGRGVPVLERLLEYTLDARRRFLSSDAPDGAAGAKADRIDLLEDGTFRVYDYKLSRAPTGATSPTARVCGGAGSGWTGDTGDRGGRPNAAYISFGKGDHYEPLARDEEGLARALAEGEARLVGAVEASRGGRSRRLRRRSSVAPTARFPASAGRTTP